MSSLRDTLTFLREFLRHPFQTGALMPSSASLADAMVHAARVSSASSIVELGSGTGVCTERIQHAKKPHASFLVLEINDYFVHRTRERCPDVTIHHDSAAHLADYLSSTGEKFDAIICGVPWTAFPSDMQKELLTVIHTCLADGGRFVTFLYLQSLLFPSSRRFLHELQERFSHVQTTPILWNNMPPAYLCIAEKVDTSDMRDSNVV